MRTAVSIPDDVYAEAEDHIRRLGISRSELYANAIREYLARHDPDAVTAALNRVYDDMGADPDPAIRASAIETLKRVEW